MDRGQCTICQDYLVVSDTVGCPCGHTFHSECINQWIKVNNSCPQCRKGFLKAKPIKLFFNVPDGKLDELDAAELKNQVEELKTEIKQKDIELKTKQEKFKSVKKELKVTLKELEAVRQGLDHSDNVNSALKQQLTFLEKHKEEAIKAKLSSERLQRSLDNLQFVKDLVTEESQEAERVLKRFSDKPDSINQVVNAFVIMKKEYSMLKNSKNKLNEEKKVQKREIDDLRRKLQASNAEQKTLQDQLELTEIDLRQVETERQGLMKKVNALEQAFMSPSPRASAIKRLLKESPAPMAFKKARFSSDDDLENSYITNENIIDNARTPPPPLFEESQNEDVRNMAAEIGLKIVNTTTVKEAAKKVSFKEVKRTQILKPSSHAQSSAGFPVVQKGYNGLGGQSKFIKPSVTKKLSSKMKIPRSSASTGSKQSKLSMTVKNPPLPNLQLL